MNTLQELPTPIVLSYYYLIQCLAARLLCTKEWKMKPNMSFIFSFLESRARSYLNPRYRYERTFLKCFYRDWVELRRNHIPEITPDYH